jgi:hypothetical protein
VDSSVEAFTDLSILMADAQWHEGLYVACLFALYEIRLLSWQ